MNPVDAVDQVRGAAHRALPPGLRSIVDWKIKRITVSLNSETICRVGRMVQHAVAAWAMWTDTKVDDKAAQMLDTVLDAFGCPE